MIQDILDHLKHELLANNPGKAKIVFNHLIKKIDSQTRKTIGTQLEIINSTLYSNPPLIKEAILATEGAIENLK